LYWLGFAPTGQAEEQNVVSALDEGALAQRRQHLRHTGRQALAVEQRERLLRRQVGDALVALDAPAPALLDLERHEVAHVLQEAPAFALGLRGHLLGVLGHRRQPERAQEHRQRLVTPGRGGHRDTCPSRTS
jgi:hypothetical protein